MGLTHHAGISVYGSGATATSGGQGGYNIGEKGKETPLFPTGLARVDAGQFGVSGWIKASHSTRLSSIIYAVASINYPATGLATNSSGQANIVGTNYSGGAIDFTMYYTGSGAVLVGNGMTSAGTSNVINWMAIG